MQMHVQIEYCPVGKKKELLKLAEVLYNLAENQSHTSYPPVKKRWISGLSVTTPWSTSPMLLTADHSTPLFLTGYSGLPQGLHCQTGCLFCSKDMHTTHLMTRIAPGFEYGQSGSIFFRPGQKDAFYFREQILPSEHQQSVGWRLCFIPLFLSLHIYHNFYILHKLCNI